MINEILSSHISALSGMKRGTINTRVRSLFQPIELTRSRGNHALLKPEQARRVIEDRLALDPNVGKFLYLGNLKGGVGKTTLANLLADAASSLGIKTCVVDLDPQGNLTNQYIDTDIDVEQLVMLDVIENKAKIQDTIMRLSSTLDLIPSSIRNNLIQKALTVQPPKNHFKWFNSICLNYLRSTYELIIVDTPPHLTTLNSVFCLCLDIQDQVVIPVCADEFSVMGVTMFLNDYDDIRESYDVASARSPKISILMNKFFQLQTANLQMFVKMGQKYGNLLAKPVVRDNAKIREIIINKTLFSKATQHREIYETIARLFEEFGILKTT